MQTEMTATNLMNKQQTRGDEMNRKKCLEKKRLEDLL